MHMTFLPWHLCTYIARSYIVSYQLPTTFALGNAFICFQEWLGNLVLAQHHLSWIENNLTHTRHQALSKSYSHAKYRPLVRIIACPYIFVVSFINSGKILGYVKGVKTPPWILYHFVVLAPGNSQEQSQMNTNVTHAKTTYHAVSDRHLNSCIDWLQVQLWNS